MNEMLLILWLVLWVILLIMSTIDKRGVVFGFIAGIWILFMGIYVILDGIQIQSGMTVTGEVGNQVIVYSYSEILPPFSNYSTMWGLPFILLGFYICWLSATAKKKTE